MPLSVDVCCRPTVLNTLDVLISCFFICPATILYWSGTWRFLDINVYPHHPYAAACLFLLSGLFILISGYFALPMLEDLVVLEDLQRDFTKHLVVSKIFNYVAALGHIFTWKGIWMLTNASFGESLQVSLIVMFSSLSLLLLIRSISNAITTPFVLHLDNAAGFYKTAPRFRTELTPDSVFPYSFDVLFTCLIVQPLSICLWVGLWNTFNAVLYPDNKQMSYLISASVGMGGALLMFVLQTPVQYIARKLRDNQRVLTVLFTSVFHMIIVFLGFMLWRGCWGYLDEYILVSYDDTWLMILFHCVGMGFLLFAQAGRTAAILRCGVDGEIMEGGTAVELKVQFLHYFCRYRENLYSVQVEPVDESQSLLDNRQYAPTPVYGGF